MRFVGVGGRLGGCWRHWLGVARNVGGDEGSWAGIVVLGLDAGEMDVSVQGFAAACTSALLLVDQSSAPVGDSLIHHGG